MFRVAKVVSKASGSLLASKKRMMKVSLCRGLSARWAQCFLRFLTSSYVSTTAGIAAAVVMITSAALSIN